MSFKVSKKYPQGLFCWADVASTEIKKTEAFLSGLMGWRVEHAPTDKGPDYTMFYLGDEVVAGGMPTYEEKDEEAQSFWANYMITNNGRANGGIMEIDPSWGEMPSHWIPYFTVESITEAEEKSNKLGGSIITPMIEAAQGKMLRVADPTGAMMMLIELSVPADEWEE